MTAHYQAHAPALPSGRFEVIVEPAEEDLVGRQAEELLQRLVVLEQAVEFGMELDVDFREQAPTNNLPD